MEKIKKGFFITFEGIEGAGKTTLMKITSKIFLKKGFNLIVTREPGGTKLSESIRRLLLTNKRSENIFEHTELLLMLASRAQHINELIKPSLEEGKIVLCDRFNDASFAYQGGGRKIDNKTIQKLINLSGCGIIPDLTILLDLPASTGLLRAKGGKGVLDRIESEKLSFFSNVRKKYLDLAKQYPARFHTINSSYSKKLNIKKMVSLIDSSILPKIFKKYKK